MGRLTEPAGEGINDPIDRVHAYCGCSIVGCWIHSAYQCGGDTLKKIEEYRYQLGVLVLRNKESGLR